MQFNNLFLSKIVRKSDIPNIFSFSRIFFYSLEIFTSSQIFGVIFDKLRFRVHGKTYCFAYGSVSRCNYGVQMSLIGLLVTIYAITLNVSSNFITIPPFMKFDELELCTFRLGIWLITGTTLNDWFVKKFLTKYGSGSGNPRDRMKKIQRMDKMIGTEIRFVRRMLFFTELFDIIIIIIIVMEKLNIF
ncbi:hypothetical protein [Guillardia theta]|uniref:Uncharacterized protein n=1 Tax=Guillardia theta TaxID=55529 RepID=Q9AW52_GUITH|nr:hypothetical protein GTHECHR2151 [Guillardia theta]CAC27018.1 hypothetical protein [Guillardia theta]